MNLRAFLVRHWPGWPALLALVTLIPGNALIGPGVAAATMPVELLSLTQLWRFEATGTVPPATWHQPGFDDSAWASGPGVLAVESDNTIVMGLTRTPLSRTGINGYKVTDYFRARFTLPELRPGWFVVASNLVDDGAVFYLNGREWFRHNMPTGVVDSSTLAVQTIDIGREGIFAVTNLPASGLVAGENVLAVEVHQPYVTSSDTVLGAVLILAPQQPPVLTRQPRNRVVREGAAASIDVSASGSVLRYQWYKNGEPLPGATEPMLLWRGSNDGSPLGPGVGRVDAGHYRVVIANDVGSVTSRVATVTIAPDERPPSLVSARRSYGIDVTFSEAIDEMTATNPANYRLIGPDGGRVPVVAVNYHGWDSVGLDVGVDGLTPGVTHLVFVSGVRDRRGNEIEPDSGVVVANTVTNVPLASAWRYDDTGRDFGTAWREPSFDDHEWQAGPALLYNDPSFALSGPGVPATWLRVTNASGYIVTHYFRQRFMNAVAPVDARLVLRHYLDDGAVFYLNGREILRRNVRPGELGFGDYALNRAFEGIFSDPAIVSSEPLVTGENVLAVEVHQFEGAAPDVSFGIELTVEGAPLTGAPPRILGQPNAETVLEGGSVSLRTQVLEAEAVQWWKDGAPLAGATRTELILDRAAATWDGSEFWLVASNRFGSARSRPVALTVIADRISPRLVGARAGTNVAAVALAFSEPVDPVSAEEAFRYRLMNPAGLAVPVLSARLTNGTNVILVTAPRVEGGRHTIAASGVRDQSAAGNPSSPDGAIAIEQEMLVFSYEQVWRYEEGAVDLGTSWRESDYNDSTWPSGRGLLGFENPALLPAPLMTTLSSPQNSGVTDYFRTRFTLPQQVPGTMLRLRHVVDDGVVFYLNGREVHRIRVPEGQNYGTYTLSTVEAVVEGPFEISGSGLVSGPNVLAAEVHQNSSVSADVVFGAELTVVEPTVPGSVPPSLAIHRRHDSVLVTWEASDGALERAMSPAGPWERVTSPRWPHRESVTTGPAFFRLSTE